MMGELSAQDPVAGLQDGSAADVVLEVSNAQTSWVADGFVASPAGATVQDVRVREGDRVQSGMSVVQLQTDLASAQLIAAEAAADAAKLRADDDIDQQYARRTLEVRRRELSMSEAANTRFAGAVPESELDKQRLVVAESELAIEKAVQSQRVAVATAEEKRAAAEVARIQLRQLDVRSARPGVVTEVAVVEGEFREPGAPLVRITTMDPLRVECFIDGGSFDASLVGKSVQFEPTGLSEQHVASNRKYSGQVTFVSPELNAVNGQTKLWAQIANPDHSLPSGVRGRLRVLTQNATAQDPAAEKKAKGVL